MYDNNIIYNTVYRKSNTKGVYFVFQILLVYTIYDVWLFSRETSVPRSIYYYYTTHRHQYFAYHTDGRLWIYVLGIVFRSETRNDHKSEALDHRFYSPSENARRKRSKRTRNLQCSVILKFVYDYGYLRFTIL